MEQVSGVTIITTVAGFRYGRSLRKTNKIYKDLQAAYSLEKTLPYGLQ